MFFPNTNLLWETIISVYSMFDNNNCIKLKTHTGPPWVTSRPICEVMGSNKSHVTNMKGQKFAFYLKMSK